MYCVISVNEYGNTTQWTLVADLMGIVHSWADQISTKMIQGVANSLSSQNLGIGDVFNGDHTARKHLISTLEQMTVGRRGALLQPHRSYARHADIKHTNEGTDLQVSGTAPMVGASTNVA